MKRYLPLILILGVLIVALGVFWRMTSTGTNSTPPASTASTQNRSATGASQNAGSAPVANPVLKGVPGAEPPHAVGPANAPVTLEEFGDFECPPCGLLHPILQNMEREYGDRLRVIFREFPLVPTHPHALNAARAAEAAGLQGKFWEMHHLLYENQKTWHEAVDARPIFEGYAAKIGLDLARYRSDLNSATVERRIFLDGKRAHSLGVKGTPTVFLNGREVPFQSLEPDKLRGLINAELAALSK